jgi:hypothetical protein
MAPVFGWGLAGDHARSAAELEAVGGTLLVNQRFRDVLRPGAATIGSLLGRPDLGERLESHGRFVRLVDLVNARTMTMLWPLHRLNWNHERRATGVHDLREL